MAERVLVVSSTFPQYEEDPRGEFIRRHWESAARSGAKVRVLAPRTSWSRDDFRTPLDIRRFAYAPRSLSSLTGHFGILENLRERVWRGGLLPLYAAGCERALAREIESFRPTKLAAHMWLPSGPLVANAARRTGIPFELYGHGTDVDVCLRAPKWLRTRLMEVFDRAEALYVPSRDKLDCVRAAMGVDVLPAHYRVQTMVHASPRPRESETRHSSPGSRTDDGRILFLGRLIQQKGVGDLLEAVARIGPRPVDIAGDGPLRPALERQAAQLRVDATFHGFVNGEQKWGLLRNAGLLCVPSREHRGLSEGAPLVIEEATAMGVPIVAYATGGIPEMCDGRTGATLVPAQNTRALAAAMAAVLERSGHLERAV